jgi:membrane-associated protease RseP (regulator of RpoE activity)
MNRHLGLFLLTVVTTTAAGALNYVGFLQGVGTPTDGLGGVALALNGLWFSVPFLGFLTAHEFGHYGAARWHGLRPSLPYYIPFLPLLTGSLGAVIVFRGRFPNRRILFDFAAGGPLAGFVVAVVALAIGLHWSAVIRIPSTDGGWLGEPLMYHWLEAMIVGPIPEGKSVLVHPTALAGWFGLLFTMMNLVPVSQLDGGHITYAVIRRHSRWVSVAGLLALVSFVLWYRTPSWILWIALLLGLTRVVGWEHPPSEDDETPLDVGRFVVAGLLVAIFVVCFMPVPMW